MLRNPVAHKAAIFEVLWAKDPRLLVTGSGDRVCRWVTTLTWPSIVSAQSLDGGCFDRIWDLNSPGSHEVLKGHSASVKAIAQSESQTSTSVDPCLAVCRLQWSLLKLLLAELWRCRRVCNWRP